MNMAVPKSARAGLNSRGRERREYRQADADEFLSANKAKLSDPCRKVVGSRGG